MIGLGERIIVVIDKAFNYLYTDEECSTQGANGSYTL